MLRWLSLFCRSEHVIETFWKKNSVKKRRLLLNGPNYSFPLLEHWREGGWGGFGGSTPAVAAIDPMTLDLCTTGVFPMATQTFPIARESATMRGISSLSTMLAATRGHAIKAFHTLNARRKEKKARRNWEFTGRHLQTSISWPRLNTLQSSSLLKWMFVFLVCHRLVM